MRWRCVVGRGARGRQRRSASVVASRPKPWGTIAAVGVVVLLAAVVFGYVYVRAAENRELAAALEPFTPTEANPDPSTGIPGVVVREFEGANHVGAWQRVAYDATPPFGGPHDQSWAACDGVVYDEAIRVENVVHSLEHGAVWIAYHPDEVTGADLDALRDRVRGENYLLMSPVPTLDAPISLQSWGHQLKLDSARDERIDQFIAALRTNRFTHPEVGATCGELGPGRFDRDNPPPFDPTPPGPDALPMTGAGAGQDMPGAPAGEGTR
nr:DUF3105 domain-containing protein [Amycolatopsis arida]